MIYLSQMTFPSNRDLDKEFGSSYPYNVFAPFDATEICFEPITIFYGNNGSGKSTALNIIAEKTKISRDSTYNKSSSFPNYINKCKTYIQNKIPKNSKIITSDDVFDYILEIRCLNDGINVKREDVCQEYLDAKHARFQLKSMADYDELKTITKARRETQTQFVKSKVMGNVSEHSNGESAFKYFVEKIGENGLYVLDEPENSLSPSKQLELKKLIEDSARFFKCQFIISTHSPFLLAMQGARIYDFDKKPAITKHWTKLENVRVYRDFFISNEKEF